MNRRSFLHGMAGLASLSQVPLRLDSLIAQAGAGSVLGFHFTNVTGPAGGSLESGLSIACEFRGAVTNQFSGNSECDARGVH